MERKKRESNFELLRIVAMLLIVSIHVNNAVGYPKPFTSLCGGAEWAELARDWWHTLCCLAVDVFVLISGWFGIRYSGRGLARYAFQCLSLTLGVALVMLALGEAEWNETTVKRALLLREAPWFATSYLLLYIFSPALNAFVEACGRRGLVTLLAVFYVFQSVYNWYPGHGVGEIKMGYSGLSFMALYLLARGVRLYIADAGILERVNRWAWVGVALLMVTVSAVWGHELTQGGPSWWHIFQSYASPMIIIGALAMVLFFRSLKLRNLWVNQLAEGSFAVYLIHESAMVRPILRGWVRYLVTEFSGSGCLLMLTGLVLTVYMTGVLIDRIRLLGWQEIEQIFIDKRKQ